MAAWHHSHQRQIPVRDPQAGTALGSRSASKPQMQSSRSRGHLLSSSPPFLLPKGPPTPGNVTDVTFCAQLLRGIYPHIPKPSTSSGFIFPALYPNSQKTHSVIYSQNFKLQQILRNGGTRHHIPPLHHFKLIF